MKKQTTAFKTYVEELHTHYSSGQATEHAYRPTLEGFIRSFGSSIAVTNEPGQRGNGSRNKPDFVVMNGKAPPGYIETKEVDIDQDDVKDTNQIERYCEAYPNLIVIDYVEFRRYVRSIPIGLRKCAESLRIEFFQLSGMGGSTRTGRRRG